LLRVPRAQVRKAIASQVDGVDIRGRPVLHVTPLIYGERDSKVTLGFARVTRGILLTLCANACCHHYTHTSLHDTQGSADGWTHAGVQGSADGPTDAGVQKTASQMRPPSLVPPLWNQVARIGVAQRNAHLRILRSLPALSVLLCVRVASSLHVKVNSKQSHVCTAKIAPRLAFSAAESPLPSVHGS
jgi:hypothetical protein